MVVTVASHALEQERVDAGRVADEPDDGLVLALRDVGPEALPLDPADEVVELLLGGGLPYYCNHGLVPHLMLGRAFHVVGWLMMVLHDCSDVPF